MMIRSVLARKSLLIFSLQRSGSNYTEQMLMKMSGIFDISIKNKNRNRSGYLHKHFRPYVAEELVPDMRYHIPFTLEMAEVRSAIESVDAVIILIRHPLNWLRSYKSFGKTCGWKERSDDSCIKEWITYVTQWHKFKPINGHFIRYEDIAKSNGKVLAEFLRELGVEPKQEKTFVSKVPVSSKRTQDEIIKGIVGSPKLSGFDISDEMEKELEETLDKLKLYTLN